MGKPAETRVEKILKWFNNNKVFSVIIIVALVIIAVGHLVDGIDKIKSVFITETPATTPPEKRPDASGDTSAARKDPVHIQKTRTAYEVTLVLPSRLSDAEILIDGQPAVILQRTLTVVKIRVAEKQQPHEITVKRGDESCTKRQWIRRSGDILYPCQ